MARSGIKRENVEKARQALIARGVSISIDAIRIELGNTGSKSTIHKHLKDIEQEEAGREMCPSLSEELMVLIGHVAKRIETEANEKIQLLRSEHQQEVTELRNKIEGIEHENSELREQHTVLQNANSSGQEECSTLKNRLDQCEQKVSHSQQAIVSRDKEIDLLTSHNASLEAKHKDARDSLSHYRESLKHQRVQERSRYDEQIAQLQQAHRECQLLLTKKQDLLTTTQSDLVEAKAALTQLRNSFESTQSAMSKLAERNTALEKEHIKIQSKYQHLLTDYDSAVSQMQTSQDALCEQQMITKGVTEENHRLNGQIEIQQSMLDKWMSKRE